MNQAFTQLPLGTPSFGPSWMVDLAWLFWLIAAVLAGISIYLLWRSLLRDPDRKKRRCPKCWYDMSGTPGLRCPECGREHSAEKKLYKRRRRRALASIGMGTLIVAFAVGWSPRVAKDGWLGSAPTWALVTAAWIVPTDDGSLLHTAASRAFAPVAGAPTNAQSTIHPVYSFMLNRSASRILHRPVPSDPDADEATGIAYRARLRSAAAAAYVLNGLHLRGQDVSEPISAAILHKDIAVQRLAILTLARIPDSRIRTALRACLESPDAEIFFLSASFLSEPVQDVQDLAPLARGIRRHRTGLDLLPSYREPGINVLVEMLNEPFIATAAARTLFEIPDPGEKIVAQVLAAAQMSQCPHGREWCVFLLTRWGRLNDAETQQVMAKLATEDSAHEVRHAAISALSHHQSPTPVLVPALTRGLKDSDPSLRYFCSWRLASTAPDGFAAIPALEAIANDPSQEERTRQAAAKSLKTLNAELAKTLIDDPAESEPVPHPSPSP